MRKWRQGLYNANRAHHYHLSADAPSVKTNRDLWFGWNNSGRTLFIIQIPKLLEVCLAAHFLLLARYSLFWGGNTVTSYFYLFIFLLWYSDTLQMKDSSWNLETEAHELASASINCLGHQQGEKSHLFLYCTAEVMQGYLRKCFVGLPKLFFQIFRKMSTRDSVVWLEMDL